MNAVTIKKNDLRVPQRFMETGNILQRMGAGQPSTSGEDVEHICESFECHPQKSNRIWTMTLTDLDNKTLGNVLSHAVSCTVMSHFIIFVV